MKKCICAAFAVCSLLAFTPGWGAGSVQEQGRAGRVEVGPFLGGYVFDEDLELKDSVVGGARGGYWLTDQILGELSLAGVPTEEEHGDDRASLLQTHADLLYHFDLGWRLEPFVAAGLGVARYNADSQGGGDWDFLVDYGVGARYWVNDRIAARVDLRQPITFGSPKFNFMYTVGVSFLLGGAPSAPMATISPPPAPTAVLTASPSALRRGQSAVLSWRANDATDVSIDGIGPVGVSGTRSVSPLESTTYRLTAKGPGGAAEVTAPVTVTMPLPPAPAATLTASPNAIEQGQSATLTWRTQNATDVSIEGVGAVEASGSRTVAPQDSTTYRLTAGGPGGQASAATSVAVIAPPRAPTATLTATPGTVRWGEPTTLSWAAENATDVSIDGVGAVAATGSQSFTPNAATTYRLLAKGQGGTAEATARVAVELPEKMCISLHIEFDFDKADIKPRYHKEIGRVAEFLKTYPKTTAVIEGHTDNVGTKQYNQKLSLRRANAVVAYLVDKYGVEPGRLSSKGYGFSRPVADNATEEGRQKNRRIDAVIDCVVK